MSLLRFVSLSLFMSFVLPALAEESPIAGHVWETGRYGVVDAYVHQTVRFDFRIDGQMTIEVLCMDRRTGEGIRAVVTGPVQLTSTEILNTVPQRKVVYFSDRKRWCSAEMPARTMHYNMLDATHFAVLDDKFFPDGVIWKLLR